MSWPSKLDCASKFLSHCASKFLRVSISKNRRFRCRGLASWHCASKFLHRFEVRVSISKNSRRFSWCVVSLASWATVPASSSRHRFEVRVSISKKSEFPSQQEIQVSWPSKLALCQQVPLAIGLKSEFPSQKIAGDSGVVA